VGWTRQQHAWKRRRFACKVWLRNAEEKRTYPIATGVKAAGAWSRPLTSI
jgi:hypothetical protein